MQKPKRPYELVLSLCGDTIKDIILGLNEIGMTLREKVLKDALVNHHTSISGGSDVGWIFSLVKTETADHDEYFKQLDEYPKSVETDSLE